MSMIFLTGFMGAGKSAVGRRVAEGLGWPFIDLDAETERRESTSISEIFRLRGEAAFREAEHAALASVAERGAAVVATGGGAVLRSDNQALLREHGVVVYLSVSPEEAMARLGDGKDRPLLAGQGVGVARAILDARLPVYSNTADVVVPTDGKSPEQVASEVLAAVRPLVSSAGESARPIPVSGGSAAGGYDAYVGSGMLDRIGPLVREAVAGRTLALVSDRTVWPLLGEPVKASLEGSGFTVSVQLLAPGESSKSWEDAGRLLDGFAAEGLDRDSTVMALGGGVVGDLAGFCAATYMRGIAVVQAPTTLLAQVDSAIGGKTGVDLQAGKNLAGAFWPPRLVVADTAVLSTLPPAEWTNGLVELVKAAFLEGGQTLAFAEREMQRIVARHAGAVEPAVRSAIAFKAEVVSQDLREADVRECLNLGHTLGHALELLVGYGVLPHGLAVAEGMRFAASVAESVLGTPADLSSRIADLLEAVGAGERACRELIRPAVERLQPAAVLKAMKSDKKSRGGAVRLVLLEKPGSWRTMAVSDEVLLAELERWSHDLAGGE